jgi:chromosome partitioning protein
VNILAVPSQKGETGKSTLVRSLAVAGLLDKRKVAIIDADPQGTVVAWGKRREHKVPHIVALRSSTIASQVEALKGRGANLVIIDTPPHAQPIVNMATEAPTDWLIRILASLPPNLRLGCLLMNILAIKDICRCIS